MQHHWWPFALLVVLLAALLTSCSGPGHSACYAVGFNVRFYCDPEPVR